MDFLDSFVIPQSADNLNLLKYIIILALILFLPYLGFLKGASLYSLVFNIIGRRKGNDNYIRLSKELIDIAVYRKSIPTVLGVLPLLTLIFSYAQIFHASKVNLVPFIIIAAMMLVISFILLYSYKYTFHLDSIIRRTINVPEKDVDFIRSDGSSDIKNFTESNLRVLKKSGFWGTLLLYVSSYFVIAGIQLSYDAGQWASSRSIFSIIFSVSAVTKYIYFLIISFAVTSAGILYFYSTGQIVSEYREPEYDNFVRRLATVSGILFTIILPVFLLVNLFLTPAPAISVAMFTISAIILLILLLLCHLFYLMLKQSTTSYTGHIFYLFIIFFVLFIINDQVAFSYSTRQQVLALSENYAQIEAERKEKSGQGVAVSGQEIFEGRCSACHQFDQKLVGPAYKDVLPKYEGKMEDLVGFILNPVKVDPAFPPMPNQGVKPNEARAVAEYIMNTYKGK